MNADEFQNWCQKLQLRASTCKVINTIRTAPPSRRVQGRAKNVSGVYPSQKMGLTIQFESHTVELWAVYQMEHDAQVLEFYDQPSPFKIQYQSRTGRRIAHYHTPDFFVLRADGAGWEEWKPEAQLQKLAQKYPSRYQRSETGNWRCPPGEAYAEPFGLSYRVRSDAELEPTFIQNLMFLEDYFGFASSVSAPIQTQVLNRVQAEPGITLAALLASSPGVRADDVYALIAQEQLYTDLYAVPLVGHWRVQLYREQQIYEAHKYLSIGQAKLAKLAKTVTLSELLDTFIAQYYETPRQAPAISVYRAYQRASEQQGIPYLSTSTFYQRLRKRRGYEQTKKRQGAKAAYARQPWVWELARSTPRHGDRPLAIAHIDHTQLDIELRSQATGRLLGRPWATLLMDAYSRRILAVYLTFDAPSYRSCMMALRICVSRFGRFPQTVIVDGGSEFHSVYFDPLLARYCCVKKTRPGGKPRFGSVIERLFGTTNTELIFNLLGNTQAAKQVRQLTKAIDPKRQAVWTLGDLYGFLKEWAYQVYDQGEHEALGTTPREAYMQGVNQAGEREHRRIPYNEEFLMATRPSTPRGEATVQPGKGIKVNYLYYWSNAFRNPEVERTKVSVRYDPFDVGVAYAYVLGCWVKCISQYYSIFEGHSEKELLLASQEIKQQGRLTRTSPSVSAKRLAEFIANVQEHETLLLQRLRDLEGKQVQSALIDSEIEAVTKVVSRKETEMVRASQATPPRAKETEVEVPPVDLSRLPVFGEYR